MSLHGIRGLWFEGPGFLGCEFGFKAFFFTFDLVFMVEDGLVGSGFGV